MHVSVYLEAESPCQFPVFQTTHFGALVRLLFHELLGLQLRRLLRWSSIGAREGFYLLCSLLLEPLDDSPDEPGVANAWDSSAERGAFGSAPSRGA